MADFDYDPYGASPRFSADQLKRIFNLAGAVSSVALMIGVAVWGYKLAVRDVTGIPVFRAAEGPARIAPSNPGGEIADHIGMAVNAVAEEGGAAALPESVMLAPAPVTLDPEDVAGLSAALPPALSAEAALALPQSPEGKLAPLEAPLAAPAVAESSVEEPPVANTDEAVARALAEALMGEGTESVDEVVPSDDKIAGAVSHSPRPRLRPQGSTLSQVETVSAPAVQVHEIQSETLAAGTRLVQLGAFDTPDQARSEWIKLAGKFSDLMGAKSMVVQSAESGGRMFYRLRAHGFSDEDDARRFCTALLAEDTACIPVAQR
jgi:hypothetical protein